MDLYGRLCESSHSRLFVHLMPFLYALFVLRTRLTATVAWQLKRWERITETNCSLSSSYLYGRLMGGKSEPQNLQKLTLPVQKITLSGPWLTKQTFIIITFFCVGFKTSPAYKININLRDNGTDLHQSWWQISCQNNNASNQNANGVFLPHFHYRYSWYTRGVLKAIKLSPLNKTWWYSLR